MEKKTVRLEIKEKLKKLNQRELHKFHKEINSHISNSRLFLEGKVIMAYLAVPGEASVDASISTALSMGKTVCVPFILEEEGQMQAVRLVSLKKLGTDRFGIRTPQEPVEVIAPEDIDLVLVPGLGFTAQGDRLGKGKGYYDRYLPRCRNAVALGVAFEAQRVPEAAADEQDRQLDGFVTERKVYRGTDEFEL